MSLQESEVSSAESITAQVETKVALDDSVASLVEASDALA